jgi:hypothetical protein
MGDARMRRGHICRAHHPPSRSKPRCRALAWRFARLALIAALSVAGGQGSAGHQVGHYPSYYPDEIRIDWLDPAAAAEGLRNQTLHAYVGSAPQSAAAVPEHAKAVHSLGGFVVLSMEGVFNSRNERCAAALNVMARLQEGGSDFVFHPYPITPYHADYLHHLDRIEAAVAEVNGASASAPIAIAGKDALAQAIVRGRWGAAEPAAQAVLETVAVADVLGHWGAELNGWSLPPWLREGWFQAYQLLAPAVGEEERLRLDQAYRELLIGETRSFAEHVAQERRLVTELRRECRRLVVGYTLRQEHINDSYPDGVENVGFDALTGLNAPLFIRTVKLKDYPWNGKLRLGVPAGPQAAWNPVTGFSDGIGRLLWAAVGDAAMVPFPANASWMPNRIQSEATRVVGQSGGLSVPADALRPEPGSGALRRVGAGVFASTKVTYEVLASPFEDGSAIGVADLLYPFAFAYRWGAATAGLGGGEPQLAKVLAALEERLVGFKYVRTDKTKHAVAEGMDVEVQTPVLEVFLRNAPWDERQAAALAPPWSTVPWHLLVLMEEAVSRGLAAFSEVEARRLGRPWLDLVRDADLIRTLRALIATFERESFRPESLKDVLTAQDAQQRWRALAAFADANGHLLVSNGPYRLKHWDRQSVVLEAVRDLTYPLGFGTFDRFVHPPRATIETVEQDANTITISASAEMLLKAGRQYRMVKEPLLRTTMRGVHSLFVVSRYLLIAADGRLLAVDKMHWGEDGRFHITLPEALGPGEYTLVFAIFLDGNAVAPSAKVMRVSVAAAAHPK